MIERHLLFEMLPQTIRSAIELFPVHQREMIEEIRIRQFRPLEVITADGVWYINDQCTNIQRFAVDAFCVSQEDCLRLLNRISHHSLYTLEEELQKGYITVAGGHRVGIAGKVVVEQGKMTHLREITHFNLRLAKEVIGAGVPLFPYLLQQDRLHNLLIVAPPQCGKTTCLRDLARLAGDRYKVGIVDERSEIAGSYHGVPQYDVGMRTDVLDACPKAEGMMMMIRSMSPDLLIVDEIGRKEDGQAICEAVYAGVHVIATVHGSSLTDLQQRPTIAPLIAERIFSTIIFLSRERGPGTIATVFDAQLQPYKVPLLAGCGKHDD